MAKQTFLNLRSERQEEILNICYQEFALKGYDSASLSEIIKKCNLAKGSFYRYFNSKKELYIYLLNHAKTKRLSNLHTLLNDPSIDFFQLIKQNFMEKVQFDLDYPTIGGFLYKVIHEKDNNEIRDIINGLMSSIIEQTLQIIRLPKFSKQLINIDEEMMAYQLVNMQLWLYDYIEQKFNIHYEDCIISGKAILDIPKQELEKVIEQSVLMLQKGIAK